MIINVTVTRSDEWVKAQKVATGTNVPKCITVEIDPAMLSEKNRARIIEINGDYCNISRVAFDSDYCPRSLNYHRHGQEDIEVDSNAPSVTQIDEAIDAAFARVGDRLIKAKEAAIEREREVRKRCEKWARIPLEWRASLDGVHTCEPVDAGVDYDGPLSRVGVKRYDEDDLKSHVPDAWREAEALSDRLRKMEEIKSLKQRLDVVSRVLSAVPDDAIRAAIRDVAEANAVKANNSSYKDVLGSVTAASSFVLFGPDDDDDDDV